MENAAGDMYEAVARSLQAAGLEADDARTRLLASHAEMVYEANRGLNLTRVPADEAPILHVVDSLRGLEAMERGGDGPWGDLGSGAGWPGIPLSIVGGRHVDLIESTRKKAAFLESVCAGLCLDVTIRGIRAESAADETPRAYAAVSARAVGRLSELVELAAPLLREGGVLVAWKGAVSPEELHEGTRAAGVVGLTFSGSIPYRLPGSDARRALVVFEKTGEPRVRLPRRPGLAKRSPLG